MNEDQIVAELASQIRPRLGQQLMGFDTPAADRIVLRFGQGIELHVQAMQNDDGAWLALWRRP